MTDNAATGVPDVALSPIHHHTLLLKGTDGRHRRADVECFSNTSEMAVAGVMLSKLTLSNGLVVMLGGVCRDFVNAEGHPYTTANAFYTDILTLARVARMPDDVGSIFVKRRVGGMDVPVPVGTYERIGPHYRVSGLAKDGLTYRLGDLTIDLPEP